MSDADARSPIHNEIIERAIGGGEPEFSSRATVQLETRSVSIGSACPESVELLSSWQRSPFQLLTPTAVNTRPDPAGNGNEVADFKTRRTCEHKFTTGSLSHHCTPVKRIRKSPQK